MKPKPLWPVFLSAVAILGGFAVSALAADAPPIKIGHIRSMTGPLAITNEKMVKGFNLAMELAGYEVAGRKIEVILEDDSAKAELAIDKARKLVEKDKVDMVVGPTIGGLQMGVSTYLNRVGIPNIHSNPSPYGIIAQKQKWTFQVGGATPQIPSCGGRYAYEHLGIKTAVIIGEDSAAGHGYVDAFVKGFKNAGGKIVQEQWTPLGCSDYASYFAGAQKADGCIAWASGGDAIKFLNQYSEFGMWDKMPLLPAYQGALIEGFILSRLSPKALDALVGTSCPIQYSPSFDNEPNKVFVDAYMKKYGTPPDNGESTGYNAGIVILSALKATGGDTTPQKLMDALGATTMTITEGPVHFDAAKNSVIKNVYISKLEKKDGRIDFSPPVFEYKDVPPEGL